jgi:hypothetical protein
MIVVRELHQISTDTPAQWKGRIGQHGSIHIRYRWGVLTAASRKPVPNPFENGTIVFDQEVGERMSGYLTTEEMQTALAPVCHFLPEEEQKL